ncbi:MAG: DUF167 domain-containing protein [Blastocatellia bacterium]
MIEAFEKENSITFTISVVPRASKSEIIGETGGIIRVKISAPPVDGAANAEVVKLFAKVFGVSKSSVEIVSGKTSRTKRIRITGVTALQMQSVLG